MKKILISAAFLLVTGTMAMASMNDDRAVSLEQLPQKAQTFIKKYFAEETVSYAKQDTDITDGDYEVLFNSGCKVEFRKNGEWKDVECKMSEVPAGIVSQSIKAFVAQKHPNTKIVEINQDRRACEVKLSDGMELQFNAKGNFLHYDN